MAGYITNGVLIGLHDHKAGQYHAMQKTRCVLVSLLALVIVACVFYKDDSGPKSVYHRLCDNGPSLLAKVYSGSLSPSDFLIGYVGPTRIVKGHGSSFSPIKGLPESGFEGFLAPGVLISLYQVDEIVDPLLTDYDFGLPDVPPLWHFTERGLPAGIVHNDITLYRPARPVLVSPDWPARVWLADDTAIVEGVLTFHAYGLLSFELQSETHPRLGFGAAVQIAIGQSTCFPSIDKRGNRISISCRYRCSFIQGAQSSVSTGPSVIAIIKEN